jgi:hypothetical protein
MESGRQGECDMFLMLHIVHLFCRFLLSLTENRPVTHNILIFCLFKIGVLYILF